MGLLRLPTHLWNHRFSILQLFPWQLMVQKQLVISIGSKDKELVWVFQLHLLSRPSKPFCSIHHQQVLNSSDFSNREDGYLDMPLL